MSGKSSIKIADNRPALWQAQFPVLKLGGHKYHRGHTIVLSGGPANTGAARLAAAAALRIGSGLVTVFSPSNALLVNAMHLSAIMVRKIDGPEALQSALEGPKITSVVIGPALGVGENTCLMVEAALSSGKKIVCDADALTSFADDPARLFAAIKPSAGPVVLTPHMGEFCALFGGVATNEPDERADRLREAASASGAIVILKGAGTLVGEHEQGGLSCRMSRCSTAPPWLATAGSGDVLAGMAGGLLAQNMPAYEAASAAVWLHGEAGNRSGPAMIAEDLDASLRAVLTDLRTDFEQ